MYISIPLTIVVIATIVIFWGPIRSLKKNSAAIAAELINSATDHVLVFRAEDRVALKKDATRIVGEYETLPEEMGDDIEGACGQLRRSYFESQK